MRPVLTLLVIILLAGCKKDENQSTKDLLCSHNWVRMEVTPNGTLDDSIYYALRMFYNIRFNQDNSCEFVCSFALNNNSIDTVRTTYSLDEARNRISFPDEIFEGEIIIVDTSKVIYYLSAWNISKLDNHSLYIRTDLAQKSIQQDTLLGFIDPMKQYFVADDK